MRISEVTFPSLNKRVRIPLSGAMKKLLIHFKRQQRPLAADAGVHNNQMHGPVREISVRRVNGKRGLNDVLAVDPVGDIDDGGRGVDG